MSSNKENEKKEIEIKDEVENSSSSENEEKIEENTLETEESKIPELESQIQELKDTLLRKAAEFENYKRRTENDQLNLLKYSAESFILKVLPVYDDLQRSVNHIEHDNNESLKEGLKLVFDKFTKILDEQGVKKIETEGKEFDVDYHEALMQQPTNDVPDHTIINEVEPGYIYKDKVIKHAKVIVSQSIETDGNDLTNDEE